jgi:hypothetical protein
MVSAPVQSPLVTGPLQAATRDVVACPTFYDREVDP